MISPNGLHIPYTLEFQVMYRHNSLDAPEKFILLELSHADKPVPDLSASHDSGSHPDGSPITGRTESTALEKNANFSKSHGTAVIRLRTTEVIFIVNEIELDSIIFHPAEFPHNSSYIPDPYKNG